MEKWRVIDCTRLEGRISSNRGAVVISPNSSPESRVPVADVAIILVGISVGISAAAIHRLTEADVSVVFCDWKGVPYAGTYSWSEHGRVGARHRSQANLSLPKRKKAWTTLVKAKVINQSLVLKELNIPDWKLLNSLAKDVRSGDPSNIEARAARIYWSALWGADGFKRLPGKQRDARNGMLDYGYTVLRGHGIRAVVGAGLSPALGVFHRGRSNNFALVDDLIEPFRPSIDFAVATADPNIEAGGPEMRRMLVSACNTKFMKSGERIPTAFSEVAIAYARFVEGNDERFQVPDWVGPGNG